jgi:5-hydroxyisourate hydrolase-like protein (transthyretin family)
MKPNQLALFFGFILFVSFRMQAQTTKTYEDQWKKVEDLINKKNLPKSALEEVRKIHELAKTDKQDAQLIKALIYMSTLQQENREDNQPLSIRELERELADAKEPNASILRSMLGNLYWQYFQRHRYQLYNRTNTVSFKKEDLATWTAEDFHKKIADLYVQSLHQRTLLQQTKLDAYDAIINKGNMRKLRPTLYDLLAHSALRYFKSSERDIKKPAYAFEINQPAAFAPAATFMETRFTTNDSLSLQHKALLIYQELLRLHITDKDPAALIDADIERLQFVYQNAVADNKEELYRQALEQLIQKWKAAPVVAQAQFLLASYYNQLASQYNPLKDTANRYARLQARSILERVVKDSSVKHEGWTNSFNLLREINRPEYRFDIEKVNVPGQSFRTLVTYKNISSLHFRIIKADTTIKKLLRNLYRDKDWDILLKAASLRSWQQALPVTNDLQEHAVEVKVDALPIGEYILLTATDESFKRQGRLGAQFFHVSNISYITQNNQYFVLHRETGQPIANAAVQLFTQVYDYRTSSYKKKDAGSYRTNKNGYFEAAKQVDNQQNGYLVEITSGNDYLNLEEPIYRPYYSDISEGQPKPVKQIFYFTDRSIYRPGQTVYFKGIVLEKNNADNSIVTSFSTTLLLRNANGEMADSLQVTTNEFGSFNGKFTLPQEVLNGEFSITDKAGINATSFSVEEYKRPKYYVGFEKVKATYKVGDSVTVTGFAKAYAGNNIDGAKVSYRVVRQPRFIYPWLTWRWWLPQAAPMEIAHGEAVTDNDGKFNIRFVAIPDKKIDRKLEPVFDYRVYTDITDRNGETRSGEYLVSAGYKSLVLKVTTPEKVATDSLTTVMVRPENMNGEYQSATITLTINKLLPEQRLIRKRYWQQPDQFIYTKEEYIRHFPNDEYSNESSYQNWGKGETVLTKTDSSRINGQWQIANEQLEAGFYEMEFTTKDNDGQEVKDIRYIEVFNPKAKTLAYPTYLWTKGTDRAIEPGEKTAVQIGSAAKEIYLIQATDKGKANNKPEAFAFNSLNNEKKSFGYDATDADRGGFGVGFLFIKHNRLYQFNETVMVPWSNKELAVTYSTFRDKLLPGSEEQWKVTISGPKGDKAAAEVLASMYDASLDQFKPHNWTKPSIWPTYNKQNAWQAGQNFTAAHSLLKWINEGEYRSFDKVYDRFIYENTGDLFFGNSSNIRIRGAASRRQNDMMMEQSVAPIAAEAAPVQDALAGKVSGLEIKDTSNPLNNEREADSPNNAIQIRKNFNETAFFFPDLKTDAAGNITFSFTTPEALTRWKLQTLAHTKALAFGLSEQEIVTQKELMVQPNAPRFLRQGDRLELSAKIVNLSDKEFTGQAELQLIDAVTNTSVDGWFLNMYPNQYFTVAAGQSEVVKFPIEVPYTFTSSLVWRVIARAGNYSDGEEAALPVLTNKMLVTETMPLPMRGNGSKAFSFEKLLKTNSETLQHHNLTVEYTANPAWYAVQALPYLMEQANEQTEQIWNRYYANALAMKIVTAAPRIKQLFEQWKTIDTAALLSNLQKNSALKSALLEETPWVLQAKSETEQKKNIALLFDLVRMSSELKSSLQKLREMQSENGGFVWIKRAPDDRYMTQYIVSGIGHLKQLGAIIPEQNDALQSILQTAIPYLDRKVKEDYDRLVKSKADLTKQLPDPMQVQYLYMRSFFSAYNIAKATQPAYEYYRKQAQSQWAKAGKQSQGMIALALHRTGDKKTPASILKSLKERAIINEEMGMYWKDNAFGYSWNWWYAPIETQALMIEAFSEISNDTKTVNDLRTWLIKNKQTNNWRTTKATADACYAMLLQGTEWLSDEPTVQIKLGNTTVSNTDQKAEAGTGYFKKVIEPQFIKPEMGTITVTVNQPANGTNGNISSAPSWGAVYWQYFEELDKITSAATPLKLSKQLFIEKNTDRGPVLTPIMEGTTTAVGDKIKVRIELRVDRDMEYVHMKDMRSSGLEPINVLSGYKWQGGLGYYETTKDASTSFFFPYLRKGIYVFEYPLFVTHTGNFSNGITTIQSMYAPEFSAHSEGVRLSVE